MPVRPKRPQHPRRGVTLVEMLVAVALLVLMMTIIVQVFAAATGAVSAAKTYQDLDTGLRALDSTIRQDLKNISATLTPPLNPADNKGYLEYGENSSADLQGEDTDDYLRFTVLAPEGQYFTGRLYVNPANPSAMTTGPGGQVQSVLQSQPITITSQTAEIIYFLRNGNLYRRVLLVAPERQSTISQGPPNLNGVPLATAAYLTSAFPSPTAATPYYPLSWQGVNDLSARPATNGNFGFVKLNTLGDLTNRENRYAYTRFANDYVTNPNAGALNVLAPDGIPDDENVDATGTNPVVHGDGIHDYYTSLYAGIPFAAQSGTNPPTGLVWEIGGGMLSGVPRFFFNNETMTFPYVFPGAYTKPDTNSDSPTLPLGLIHSPDPTNPQTTLAYLNALNHNPLDLGDSLPVPTSNPQTQTWFGFPTWRETLSYFWTDPIFSPNAQLGYTTAQQNPTVPNQPNFLNPYIPGTAFSNGPLSFRGPNGFNLLPPMTSAYHPVGQLFTDGGGDATIASAPAGFALTPWNVSWEDDLILSGVRSFDVKAYDNSFPGYVDLGWGDDLRLYEAYRSGSYTPPANPPLLAQTPFNTNTLVHPFTWPPTYTNPNYETVNQTYAHEGRIPPRTNDFRFDAAYGASTYAGYPGYTGNVGDDNNIVRLRRVWDTWSTDYAKAPATGYDPVTFAPIGPPFSPPVYPSFPAPYPMPLRGLQIQIRVVDPSNQRVKVLTIRQDFSDKLQ